MDRNALFSLTSKIATKLARLASQTILFCTYRKRLQAHHLIAAYESS